MGWDSSQWEDSDAEDRRRRALQAAQWDPLARVQEIGRHAVENPILGGLEAAGAPFEAMGTGLQYAQGVAQGLTQAGLENVAGAARQYGWDPGARMEATTTPQQRAGLIPEALGQAGRYAGDILSGNAPPAWQLPEEQRQIEHFPFGETQTVPDVRNPFDPAEAMARYHALTPEPVQFGSQLIGGSVGGALEALPGISRLGPPTVGRAAELGKAGLRGALGEMFPGMEELQALEPSRAQGLLNAAGTALTSRPARALELGIPTEESARQTYLEEEDQPLEQRLQDTAEAGLKGLLVGVGVVAGTTAFGRIKSASAFESQAPQIFNDADKAGMTPLLRGFIEGSDRAASSAYGEVGEVPLGGQTFVPVHAGGWLGKSIEDLSATLRDRFAPLSMLGTLADNASLAVTGQSLPPEQNIKLWADRTNKIPAFVNAQFKLMLPIWERAGATDSPEAAEAFSKSYQLAMAKDAATQYANAAADWQPKYLLEPLGLDSMPKIDAAIDEWKQALLTKFPDPNLYAKHEQGIQELTGFFNNQIDRLVDAGWYTPEERDAIVNAHQVYGAIDAASTDSDSIMMRRGTGSIQATGEPVGKQETASGLISMTPQAAFERTRKVEALIVHNESMNAFNDAMTDPAVVAGIKATGVGTPPPEGFTELWRPNPFGDDVPKGFGHVQFRQDGVPMDILTDENVSDAIKGMTGSQAAMSVKLLGGMTRMWRAGVTALSLPFVIGHGTRTVQTAYELAPEGMGMALTNHLLTDWMDLVVASHGGTTAADWLDQNKNLPMVGGLFGKMQNAFQEAATRTGEFVQAGGSSIGQHSTEAISSAVNAERYLGIPQPRGGPISTLGGIVAAPFRTVADLMGGLTYIADQGPRYAAFNTMREAGAPAIEAGYAASKMGVDFGTSGSLVRELNQFLPLLNAREQGLLTTLQGAWDDPAKFAFRVNTMVAPAVIGLYAYNRQMMGDAYDQLDPSTKDRYFLFGIPGAEQVDEQGNRKPVYLSIVKNPLLQMLTSPLEHFLDAHFHAYAGTRDHPTTLTDAERTGRTAADEWSARIGMLLPWEPSPTETRNPLGHAAAGFSMFPPFAAALGMLTGYNRFREREIVPPEQQWLPAAAQANPTTSMGARGVSALYSRIVDPETAKGMSPEKVDYLTEGLFGTFGSMWMQAPGLAVRVLEENGLVDPNWLQPTLNSAVALPPGTPPARVWQYADQLERAQAKPWGLDLLSRALRFTQTGSTAVQSERARARHVGADVLKEVDDSHSFWSEYRLAAAEHNDKLRTLFTQSDKSQQKVMEEMHDLAQGLQGAFDSIHERYPNAAVTAVQSKELNAKLPGYNPADLYSQLPPLPGNLDVESIKGRVLHPEGLTPDTNPVTKARLIADAFRKVSQDEQVPVNVLKDYVAADLLGQSLPAIAIPDIALEGLRTEYFAPKDPTTGEPLDPTYVSARRIQQARDALMQRTAAQWNVPVEEVENRLLNRRALGMADEEAPMQRSSELALQLSHKLQNMPLLSNSRGENLVPDEDQASLLLADLGRQTQELTAKKIPRSQWPLRIQQLDDARRWAEVGRLGVQFSDPNAEDYERWYGAGKSVSMGTWDAYQNGELPKYKTGGPTEWRLNDGAIRMYHAMPVNSPQRDAQQYRIQRLEQQRTPGWSKIMQAVELRGGAEEETAGYSPYDVRLPYQ